jgi:hypothetical protein
MAGWDTASSACTARKGHLEHVAAAERVVSVLDVVLAERDRHTEVGHGERGQPYRSGVRVCDET